MKIVYSPSYHINLGNHLFPTAKYHRVYAALLDGGLARPEDFIEPAPVSWEDLALVHAPDYLGRVRAGSLSDEEIAALELPWSADVAEGFRLMTGGTIEAARKIFAPARTVAVHLGGGFHHAFPGHGEGFCLFNDVAVAIRLLQREGLITSAAVIDCDVHHGNGTAFIFERDPSVFTFSIHQQHNYPAFKPRGSLDIGLEDGADDRTYLTALERALPRVLERLPDVIFYLAGADPYKDDQLGGLSLTMDGLRRRDRLVLETAGAARVPVVVALAGGYARRLDDTVAIHLATVEIARQAGDGLSSA